QRKLAQKPLTEKLTAFCVLYMSAIKTDLSKASVDRVFLRLNFLIQAKQASPLLKCALLFSRWPISAAR
ncbi:hypothetical protein, partial [Spirosoma aerophilum]